MDLQTWVKGNDRDITKCSRFGLTTYIDSKVKVKAAEAETKMKIATGEISWEQAAIEASADSWKDEAWTLCFIAIVLGSFVPWLQPYMKQGFENLQAAPQWFSWAMYASIWPLLELEQ